MSNERIGRSPAGESVNTSVSNCQFPLRILVFKESVGAIIGRGGSMIRNITRETKARVDVNRKEYNSSDKAVTIYGTPESQSDACQRILSVMIEEASIANNRQEIALKILAHDDLVGRLIGKDGQTIKKIMKDSNTKINVSSISQLNGDNVDRVITIQGTVQGMMMAESLVSERLRKSFFDDLRSTATSGGLNPGSGQTSVSSFLSSNGRVNHMSEQRHRGPLSLSRWNPNQTAFPLTLNEQWTRGYEGDGDFSGKQDTVRIVVPAKAIGAIIGRKGGCIRNIKWLSGAQIKIFSNPSSKESKEEDEQNQEQEPHHQDEEDDTDDEDDGVRKIAITGFPEQQWRAQSLIFDKMKTDNVLPGDHRFTVEMIISNNKVGKLIGKGGTNIKELMARTGSRIVIENDPESRPSPNTSAIPDVASCSESPPGAGKVSVQSPSIAKRVRITGSFNAVQLAQRQILSLILQSTYSFQSGRKTVPSAVRSALNLRHDME